MINVAEALNNATVMVSVHTGPSMTFYTLAGNRKAVEEKVAGLMREYHPLGYGTTVKYTENGAIVTRSNSCD